MTFFGIIITFLHAQTSSGTSSLVGKCSKEARQTNQSLQRHCGGWLCPPSLQSVQVAPCVRQSGPITERTIILLATNYWAPAVPGFTYNPMWCTVMWPILKLGKPRSESWSNLPDVTQSARGKAQILTQVSVIPKPRSFSASASQISKAQLFSQQEVCTSVLLVTVSTFFSVPSATNCKEMSCPQSLPIRAATLVSLCLPQVFNWKNVTAKRNSDIRGT